MIGALAYFAKLIQGSGSFLIQSLSFPRRRESRNVLLKKLDARLRGHGGKNSPTAQLIVTIHCSSFAASIALVPWPQADLLPSSRIQG